jgi:hypothetical protein
VTFIPPEIPLSPPVPVLRPEFLPAIEAAPIWKARYTKFAPRVGIACRANERGSLVVRAGAGIFYHTGFASATELLKALPSIAGGRSPPMWLAPRPKSSFGYAPDLRLPDARHWNLTLER